MLSFKFCYVCFVKVLDYGLLKATLSGLHRLLGNKRATLMTTQKNEHKTEMQARSHLDLSVNKDAARRLLPNKHSVTPSACKSLGLSAEHYLSKNRCNTNM
jgi:hypothetical protein